MGLITLVTLGATKAQNTEASRKPARVLKVEKEVCLDAENGIMYYRGVTWKLQDKLGRERNSTTYPERLSSHCPYKRYEGHIWLSYASDTRDDLESRQKLLDDPKYAICEVFGTYCQQALNVSWCESHWHTTSQNGQYLGLFQMGSSERRLYGHSSTAYGQAIAAYHYFVASGRDWSPWSCKP